MSRVRNRRAVTGPTRNNPLRSTNPTGAVRLLRIQTIAEDAFANKDKANGWIRRPLAELSGETPLDVVQTEAGARAIETILAKIAWGAAA